MKLKYFLVLLILFLSCTDKKESKVWDDIENKNLGIILSLKTRHRNEEISYIFRVIPNSNETAASFNYMRSNTKQEGKVPIFIINLIDNEDFELYSNNVLFSSMTGIIDDNDKVFSYEYKGKIKASSFSYKSLKKWSVTWSGFDDLRKFSEVKRLYTSCFYCYKGETLKLNEANINVENIGLHTAAIWIAGKPFLFFSFAPQGIKTVNTYSEYLNKYDNTCNPNTSLNNIKCELRTWKRKEDLDLDVEDEMELYSALYYTLYFKKSGEIVLSEKVSGDNLTIYDGNYMPENEKYDEVLKEHLEKYLLDETQSIYGRKSDNYLLYKVLEVEIPIEKYLYIDKIDLVMTDK